MEMKYTKKFLTVSLWLAVLIIIPAKRAHASDIDRIEDARSGIVELFAGIEDQSGEFYRMQNTCGCIVGNSGSSDYIITTYAGTHASREEQEKFLELYQLENVKDTVIKLIVEGDIMVDVSVVAESAAKDFCLLKVDGVIKEKNALVLGDTKAAEVGSSIYVMGFPEYLAQVGHADFQSEELLFYKGTLADEQQEINGADYFFHTALINAGNSGGALLNASGYLIGLNNLEKSEERGQYASLSINEIRTILDNYGIVYVDQAQDTELLKLKSLYGECTGLCESGEYTDKSCRTMEIALKSAEEVMLAKEMELSVIQEQTDLLVQAKGDLKKKRPMSQILSYVLAVVLAGECVWAAVLIIDFRKHDWYQEGGTYGGV